MVAGIIERRLRIKARGLYPKDAKKQKAFIEGVLERTGIKPKKLSAQEAPSISRAFE